MKELAILELELLVVELEHIATVLKVMEPLIKKSIVATTVVILTVLSLMVLLVEPMELFINQSDFTKTQDMHHIQIEKHSRQQQMGLGSIPEQELELGQTVEPIMMITVEPTII